MYNDDDDVNLSDGVHSNSIDAEVDDNRDGSEVRSVDSSDRSNNNNATSTSQ